MNKIYFTICTLLILSGCVNAGNNYNELNDARKDDRISIGTVQREIKKGLSSAAVVEILGSPNMVSTDSEGREVWVYDKISTEKIYSNSSQSGSGFLLGAFSNTLLGGGMSGSGAKSTGASQTTQKTLTIIIKFDAKNKVRDFAYRTSKF
jgi:outer membrane protein assembly factor BamE (lipoprotein component of BamABCDE complex)